jgi:hypothetical protein
LGESRANLSSYARTWADVLKNATLQSSTNIKKTAETETQRALKEDLENSRAEVEALRERINQMENTSAEERESMEEKVRQQVDQVLKVQLEAFAKEITFQFAQLMNSQQQMNFPSAIKRSVIQLQEENSTPENRMPGQGEDAGAKRPDRKETPHKLTSFSERYNESEMCKTPPSAGRKLILTPWTGSPFTPQSNASRGEISPNRKDKNEKQMSQSKDNDNTQHGSGTKSTTKPSDDYMDDVEAQEEDDVEL